MVCGLLEPPWGIGLPGSLWGLLGRNGLVYTYTFLKLTRWSSLLDSRKKRRPNLSCPKTRREGEAGHGPWGSTWARPGPAEPALGCLQSCQLAGPALLEEKADRLYTGPPSPGHLLVERKDPCSPLASHKDSETSRGKCRAVPTLWFRNALTSKIDASKARPKTLFPLKTERGTRVPEGCSAPNTSSVKLSLQAGEGPHTEQLYCSHSQSISVPKAGADVQLAGWKATQRAPSVPAVSPSPSPATSGVRASPRCVTRPTPAGLDQWRLCLVKKRWNHPAGTSCKFPR